ATLHATANLAGLSGAVAVTDRVERFVRRAVIGGMSAADATVVLDPPRAGAGREVVDGLVTLRPAQVVYVACDPVAFARDVGVFGERGWSLVSLRAFDLFPHTHHVEALGLLLPEG
ncbi:MAG TPA: class I SAM-dependent RNA methyltransferase, partial [Terrimesophilobacter sp.]|nr:class I SAM-dependent RNA methyltransferase [Terrimesophilobacter sp.]